MNASYSYVIDRSSVGTTLIPSEALLLERRVVVLNREVSTESVNNIIQQLLVLSYESNDPILMILSSPGGEIQAGLALIDVIRSLTAPVYTLALGMAASFAAVLLAAGEKGHRIISPHSRVMVHEPLLSGGVSGSCSTIVATAQSIVERRDLINKLLAQFTGREIGEIEAATSYDHYMSAEEALEFGLVDKICSGEELMHYLKGVSKR